MLEEGIQRHDAEFTEAPGQLGRIGHDRFEQAGSGQTLPAERSSDEIRIEVDAADLAAASHPMHAPGAGSASDVQNAQRRALRQQSPETLILAIELLRVTPRPYRDPVLLEVGRAYVSRD